MKVQHWLKLMHDRPERRPASHWQQRDWLADTHFMRGGEPKGRPSYRVGDLLVVYLSGLDRCPAILEVTATPAFDPETVERKARPGDGARWGWVTPVKPIAWVEADRGPSLANIGVEPKSISRRSRLKLTPERFAKARAALAGQA